MGSSFSSSRRNSLRSTTNNTEQVPNSNGESEGSPRYPRRSSNQPQRAVTMSRYTRLGRRHTSTTSIQLVVFILLDQIMLNHLYGLIFFSNHCLLYI